MLMQGTAQRRLQTALNNLSKLAQTLGLVICREKGIRANKEVRLELNDKQTEKILTKTSGCVHWLYSNKDAEVIHILNQCKAAACGEQAPGFPSRD